jgi:hypothetical protein
MIVISENATQAGSRGANFFLLQNGVLFVALIYANVILTSKGSRP